MVLSSRKVEEGGSHTMALEFRSPFRWVRDVGDTADLNEVAKNLKSIKVENPNKVVDFPDLVGASYVDYGAFSKLREIESDRESQYRSFDAMTKDIIISSALEMYADDSTQYDSLGRLIWCESEDIALSDYVNKLLDTLEIPKKLWTIYYNLAEYGDVYIRLFKKTKMPSDKVMGISAVKPPNLMNEDMLLDFDTPYEEYVEVCDNPESIYDLVKNGKTCQYAYINKEAGKRKQERIELYPPDQFIHIYIENPHIRDRELFEFSTREEGELEVKRHVYKVRRGKSMLYDIYAVEREIQLLEDALLLNRVSRSAVIRLLNIEVGDMPDPEVQKLLRRVKNVFESKLSINTKNQSIGTYIQSSGLDNVVVSPTRNGQGSLNYQTIGGGDVDVRSLLDLDYFNDKRFGGLKIPKPFLGFEESLGSNAGETLTQLDIRYGRTIKRLQNCVTQGIKDLVNFYLLHSGKADSVNNFRIRVVTPTTTDDLSRDEQLKNKLDLVDSVMSSVDLLDDRVDKAGLFLHLIKTYVGDNRVFGDIDQFVHESSGEEEDEYSEDEYGDEESSDYSD